jgi:hypothetical protein
MTNYRVRDQVYIVDRLFDRANLLLGTGKKAQKVEISRGKPIRIIPEGIRTPARPRLSDRWTRRMDSTFIPRRVARYGSASVRVAIILTVVGLMVAFAYGGYRRTQKAQFAARAGGLPKNPTPATQAGAEVTKGIPEGTAPLTGNSRTELRPPADTGPEKGSSPCGPNSQAGQPFRFNPQTGQPCDGTPQERVVIRQAPPVREPNPVPIITAHECPPRPP